MSNNKKISGAEAVIRTLIEEGVDLIYGYPGGAIMPIYDELYKFQDKLQHVLTRHEQGATHAAQGFARVSGKVGVCVATSGPGATNLVTGIADAMIDSTPMVCITGQVPSHLLGSDAFQETDIIGISTPVTKWNYQITDVKEIPEIMAKAFYIARSGRPGCESRRGWRPGARGWRGRRGRRAPRARDRRRRQRGRRGRHPAQGRRPGGDRLHGRFLPRMCALRGGSGAVLPRWRQYRHL